MGIMILNYFIEVVATKRPLVIVRVESHRGTQVALRDATLCKLSVNISQGILSYILLLNVYVKL